MEWDPAKDEAEGNPCKAYGAPGIMRQPTHLHITWQDENTLKMEADYGTQTRLLHFGPAAGRDAWTTATRRSFHREPESGAAGRSGAELARLLDRIVDYRGRAAETSNEAAA